MYGSDDIFPVIVSSRGVMSLVRAGVAKCKVLYCPMKLLMCLTFVMSLSFVLIRELRLCGETSK